MRSAESSPWADTTSDVMTMIQKAQPDQRTQDPSSHPPNTQNPAAGRTDHLIQALLQYLLEDLLCHAERRKCAR